MCTLQVNSPMLELTRVLILNAARTKSLLIEQDPADLISFPGKLSSRALPIELAVAVWFCQDGKNPAGRDCTEAACCFAMQRLREMKASSTQRRSLNSDFPAVTPNSLFLLVQCFCPVV